MQRVVPFAVIAGTLAGSGSVARADDPFAKPESADARAHLTRGNKFYSLRDFDKAIEEYKAGALAEQAPVFDYNLGQCYRQLGNYEAAKWHYQQYLRRAAPQGEVLKAVEDFIAQMDAELQKKAMTQPPIEAAPVSSAVKAPNARAEDLGPQPPAPRSFRALAWGLTGAGIVGVGVGGGLLWNASSPRASTSLRQRWREITERRPPSWRSDRRRSRSGQTDPRSSSAAG